MLAAVLVMAISRLSIFLSPQLARRVHAASYGTCPGRAYPGSRASCAARGFRLGFPNRTPYTLWSCRHLDVADGELGESVDDRIDDHSEGRGGAAFAASSDAQGVGRGGHLADRRVEAGQHIGSRHCVVHEGPGEQLSVPAIIGA